MPTIITTGGASAKAFGFARNKIAAATDALFKYVTLLLNGDGTNGAQNNTFLDSSTNNFSITRNGNTTQGSFSPYGSLWSTFFNTSSGNYLTSSATNTSNFGSGNYTMELWLYTSSATTKQIFYDGRPTGSQSGTQVFFGISDSTGGTLFIGNSSGLSANGSTVLASNTWYHIAFVRSGTGANQCAIYINGILDVNYTDAYTYTTANNTIGAVAYTPQGVNPVLGYMSNMRFGSTAVYTTAFTPSTVPLTAITGTKMLILQSNRFIDNSTNANTFSVTGTPKVQRFSPFNPTATYSTTTIGGSGYFGASTDYLSLGTNPFSFSGGTYTLEAWVYVTAYASTRNCVFIQSSTGLGSVWFPLLSFTSTTVNTITLDGNTYIDFTGTVPLNTWTHVAVSKSGTSVRAFINGTQLGAAQTDSSSYRNGSQPFLIGGANSASSQVNGYVEDLRVNNTTALYTASFTPPTAPLTAVSGTQLLTNMTNAGIPDLAMMNDLQTVGSAQVSTAVKKYGTASLYFSGTGAYIDCPDNVTFAFGTGDFTIECWVYHLSNSTQRLFGNNNNSLPNNSSDIEFDSSGKIYFGSYNTYTLTSTAVSLNSWTHLAWVRSSGVETFYINGTSAGTATRSINFSSTVGYRIGGSRDLTSNLYNGYIDDFRITNGLARYTSNFTPPTAALPTY